MLLSVGFNPADVGGHSSEYSTLVDGAHGLRKLYFAAHSSSAYRMLDRLFPALFAFRLHVVAVKPLAHRA